MEADERTPLVQRRRASSAVFDVANTYDYPGAVPEHDQLSEINNGSVVCGENDGDQATPVQTGSDTGKHYTLLNGKLDSLDYDNCENELYLAEERSKTIADLYRKEAARWMVNALIGALTGLIAAVIDISVNELSRLKFTLVQQYYTIGIEKPSGSLFVPLFIWIGLNCACVGLAAIFTAYGEPVAAGSGIPQIKCFLNGIKIPHVVRIKTLLVKVVGVTLSVVGGLSVGKEGPMIHSGAVVAAGVSQGRSTTFGFDLKVFEYFRTDTEKRDFVSSGAAAGVAAAFGAPIGGVLFSLEEGASFWNQQFIWRMFFASMVSSFTLNSVLSVYHGHSGQLSYNGLVNFERFSDLSYSVAEFPIYIVMGAVGGLLGALFNYINYRLTLYRRRNVRSRRLQVIEALMVAMMSAMCAYLLILVDTNCQDREKDKNEHPLEMYCGDGRTSSMATLWFSSPESTVKSLFHDSYGSYRPVTLTVFCIAYFFLACWTYGLSVPSGLFIPGLVIGAAWGRLVAIIFETFFPNTPWVNPGKFALIGAAAQLGGIVRMTISLTVILVEATGSITLGLPLMIVLMIAKWVGDVFTEGVYDMHIHLQGVPFLDWEAPEMTTTITAKNVMSHPVVTLQAVEKVSKVVEVLMNERHDGFPIVENVDNTDFSLCDEFFQKSTFGNLQGMITRSQLIVLLRHRHFTDQSDQEQLSLHHFRDIYPRFPRIERMHIAADDLDRFMDLRPFMNPAPYAVIDNTSLPRIFKLFRGLGLRHLVVVDRRNEVIGVVTRKDLARYKVYKRHGKSWVVEIGMAAN